MAIGPDSNKCGNNLKFLCSYGGRIYPRSSDGELRYVGGLTRVLAVYRSDCFAELMLKLEEFCGFSVTMRCQLPNGDLETLISVKSDEDLANLIDEYDRVCLGSRTIRTVLSPPKSIKQVSPPPSVDLFTKSPVSAFGSPPGSPCRCFLPRFPSPLHEYSVRRTAGIGCNCCRVQGISRPVYHSPARFFHFRQ